MGANFFQLSASFSTGDYPTMYHAIATIYAEKPIEHF